MKNTIGRLRHRLTLEAPGLLPDGAGGETVTFTPVATVWAAVRPGSGSEDLAHDRLSGRVSHVVDIRYRDDVSPEMRFAWDARRLHILSVIDVDERRQWLRCNCEERAL